MDNHAKIAIFMVACLILGTLSLLNPGSGALQGDEQFIPDVYFTQAEPPTKDNGQHGTSVSSVTFQAGAHQVTGDLYTPTSGGPFPGIVFGVGYTEMALGVLQLEDVSNYKWIGESLASHGYVVLIVKYATSVTNILDLTSLHEWINQTVAAITYLQQNVGKVDDDRIGVMGHAVGGAVAICTAAEDKRVKNVICLAPTQLPGFQPSMYNKAALLSPVPIQIQSGPGDSAAAMTTYNSAGIPRQRVLIQSGAYEGFTDIGAYESGITIPIPWGGEITVGTRQHNHSIYYSVSFLNYYLENDDDYYGFISNDYEETETILENPIPSLPDLEYTWTSTQESEELDTVIVNVAALPDSVDLAGDTEVTVTASVVPRGVGWGNAKVEATIAYSDGAQQKEEMTLNTSRDEEAGDFEMNFDVEKNHDIDDDVEVTVEVVNTNEDSFLSDTIDIDVFSSSTPPTANLVIEKPAAEPGKDVQMSVGGSDEDGEVFWYKLAYGDGNNTGWVDLSSNPLTVNYNYESSDSYDVRLWVKDDHGAESAPVKMTVYISQKPVAKLKVDSEVEVDKKVKFDASGSSDPDGDDLEYLFDFGDGQNSDWVDTPTVSHTYTEKTRYSASLTVRDSYGVESETVTKELKVVEEKEGIIAKILGGSGVGFYLLIIIIVAGVVGGLFFVFGGKDEPAMEEIVVSDEDTPSPPEETEGPTQPQEPETQAPPPPPPVPAEGGRKEELTPPVPGEEQKKPALLPPPPGVPFTGKTPQSQMPPKEPRSRPSVPPPPTPPPPMKGPSYPTPHPVARPAAHPSPQAAGPRPGPRPLTARRDFAAPVLSEEMKRKIEERKRAMSPPPPPPAERTKPEETEEPKEEKKPEEAPKDEEPPNIQGLICPECGKEFRVPLPEKKKETGKTICPRCNMKFSFNRKDWDPKAVRQEENGDTLTFPKKPERPRFGGIDIIDIKKK